MTETLFTAQRLVGDGQSSVARWSDSDGKQLCFCLEPGLLRDPFPGIPPGSYALTLAAQTPKSAEYAKYYANKFGIGWHKGMVQIADVPGRTAIEFHVGNTLADTDGCSLAGENYIVPPGNGSGHFEVERSRIAYERVYPILRDAILAGAVTLKVIASAGAGT